MSDARTRILSNLRAGAPEAVPLPDVAGAWIRFDDPVAKFVEVLPTVGGQAHVLPDGDAATLARAIAGLPVVKEAKRVCSLVPECAGTVDLATVDDAHALADLDVTIARARLGVAENGALWLADEGIRHRAALFIAQHVVFAVKADDLVNNLHEAYARIDFAGCGFGVFISGPSKTADIEQSLVIGAHGPRSATVFVQRREP